MAREIMVCPFNGQICANGSRKDFPKNKETEQPHVCRFWTEIMGKDHQDRDVKSFDCSIAWMPFLTIQTTQAAHQTSASVDKVANEVAITRNTPIVLSGPAPKQPLLLEEPNAGNP